MSAVSPKVVILKILTLITCVYISLSFTAGSAHANGKAQEIALKCARQRPKIVTQFIKCAGGNIVLSRPQNVLVDCARDAKSKTDFGRCAGVRLIGSRLSADQKALLGCAVQTRGDVKQTMSCGAGQYLHKVLNERQIAVADCAAETHGNGKQFALCAGKRLFGNKLSKEQLAAVDCAAQSQTGVGFTACVGAKMLSLNLNPEQQIAVQCVVESGGQPYAAAGCTAGKLLARELGKCASGGFGGDDGCFGNNNDLVGRNGWAIRTEQSVFNDITKGPGPRNDLVGRDGFVGRTLDNARKDITQGPGENNDLVGKKGAVVRTFCGVFGC